MIWVRDMIPDPVIGQRPRFLPCTQVLYHGPTDQTKETLIWKSPDDGRCVHTDGEGQFVETHVPAYLQGVTQRIEGRGGKALLLGACTGVLTAQLLCAKADDPDKAEWTPDVAYAQEVIEVEWDRKLWEQCHAHLNDLARYGLYDARQVRIDDARHSPIEQAEYRLIIVDLPTEMEGFDGVLRRVRKGVNLFGEIVIQAGFCEWPLPEKIRDVFPEGDFYEDPLGWRFFHTSYARWE